MPPILSTLKTTIGRSKLLRKNGIIQLIQRQNDVAQRGNFVPVRCLSSIAGLDCYSYGNHYLQKNLNQSIVNGFDRSRILQRKWFLGCGDGEEGSVLAKVHEEHLVLGYSPEQVFAVVEAVDLYEDFLPWCQRSDIIRRNPDGSFEAELEIGFKFLVESYVSHVVVNKPKLIKTTASESNLFEHLINIWEFSPGPTPGTCNVDFLVDFKFRSPLYRQVASMFFKEVVSRLVSSFTDRCRLIYGPGTPIQQSA